MAARTHRIPQRKLKPSKVGDGDRNESHMRRNARPTEEENPQKGTNTLGIKKVSRSTHGENGGKRGSNSSTVGKR